MKLPLIRTATTTLALAVAMSAIALAWNYVFNSVFERWEARQQRRQRPSTPFAS